MAIVYVEHFDVNLFGFCRYLGVNCEVDTKFIFTDSMKEEAWYDRIMKNRSAIQIKILLLVWNINDYAPEQVKVNRVAASGKFKKEKKKTTALPTELSKADWSQKKYYNLYSYYRKMVC